MSFISFSLDYYKKELQSLESSAVSDETIYHAKQLLKMLDDLCDEGYTELNETLEKSCRGVSRLKKFLQLNGAEPFPVYKKTPAETEALYEQKETELFNAINELIACGKNSTLQSSNAFLGELVDFCEWIGYREDTAYVFLLRDTLLPYIYYRCNGRSDIYPWLIGRSTLTMLTGKECVDDEIRACIIKALEIDKCDNYNDFCKIVLPQMQAVADCYPEMKNRLTSLLKGIKKERIVVVESGCSGTFPLLLKSLDSRVDVRMFTTYPYLLKVYGDRIYSPKYEENRLFETLYSQDLFFKFSSLKDGLFYVKRSKSREVIVNSYAEVKAVLK